MYGIDSDFPIGLFVGARVVDTRPLAGIFYFEFARASPGEAGWPVKFRLGIENVWHVYEGEGKLASAEGSEGLAVAVVERLVGLLVREAVIVSPRSFELRLENDVRIEVVDDADDFESFCIPELAIYI